MSGSELQMTIQLGLIYGVVAIGIFIPFRVLNFADLTCDGSFVLGGCTAAYVLRIGFPIPIALIVAFVSGGIAGALTAFLHNRMRITDILSGILVGFMLYSVNLRILGGAPNLILITTADWTAISLSICLLSVLILGYILNSDFGLALRAVGENPILASSFGINTRTFTAVGLMVANALIGLGGALFFLSQGFYDIGGGGGTLIIGLAALMIGDKLTLARSGYFPITAYIIGSVIYRIFVGFALRNNITGLQVGDLNFLTGVFVIVFMTIRWRRGKC